MPNELLEFADGYMWDHARWWACYTDHETISTRAIPLPDGWDVYAALEGRMRR